MKNYNPRIYIYSPNNKYPKIKLDGIKIKKYVDKRATKLYCIWRVASVELVKVWKSLVVENSSKEENYSSILRGFFAGEGNIKYNSNCSQRVIRISQEKRNELIERILNHYKISFKFETRERIYVIWNIFNWRKLSDIKIADLHPEKKEKFRKTFEGFKEEHYSPNYLKESLPKRLKNGFSTTAKLAKEYRRSQARISEVLVNLKKWVL